MGNCNNIKLLHVITGLEHGGAERILSELVAKHNREKFKVVVISLTETGPIGKKISEYGVPVYSIGMRRGIPDPFGMIRLVRLIWQVQPDLIQTWMYHADLIGGLASRITGNRMVLWGIHHADPRMNSLSTKIVAKLCALLSGVIPKHIIVCSESALNSHFSFGYHLAKMTVINNGVDLGKFRPHRVSKYDDEVVIGHVARWHPIKDHQTFVTAAGIVHESFPNARFVLVGPDVDQANRDLMEWVRQAKIQTVTDLLGDQSDVQTLMNNFDIFVSSSLNESFSMVVVEAMASGVPCVATKVGISMDIIGDTGKCVPPKDPQAMADAIESILSLHKGTIKELGNQARKRIEDQFSLKEMVGKYETIYREFVL